MSADSPVEMDVEERDEFLGNGGTGVISLALSTDDPPHTIPVSYGYDATDTTFYFRLSTGGERSKGNLADQPVSFVTSSEDGRWRSVVARGHLKDVDDDAIATESLDGLDRVDIPFVDVFHRPLREVDFDFYRLQPDELTARVESKTDR